MPRIEIGRRWLLFSRPAQKPILAMLLGKRVFRG